MMRPTTRLGLDDDEVVADAVVGVAMSGGMKPPELVAEAARPAWTSPRCRAPPPGASVRALGDGPAVPHPSPAP
jgi:hypothetical protein